jgi:hypothetical protein
MEPSFDCGSAPQQHHDDNNDENEAQTASANPDIVRKNRSPMLQHDQFLSTALGHVAAGAKTIADVIQHHEGVQSRRLTRQRASRQAGLPFI